MTASKPQTDPQTIVSDLLGEMRGFVHETVTTFVGRYLPDGRMPAFMAGNAQSANDAMALVKLLAWLEGHGTTTVAGMPTRTIMGNLLRAIDGPAMEVFNSFLLSEALLKYGEFAGNPLLDGFTPAELANVAAGCDSSHIRLQHGKELGGRPNNYWGVLARCEHGRLRLGLISDASLFEEALGRITGHLLRNPTGYFDDHRDLAGRYDIYLIDVLLFLEPLWARIGSDPAHAAQLERMLRNAVGLVETVALDGGVSIAWGRTINGHSQAMLMELMAVGLVNGWTTDPGAAVRRMQEGFTALRARFAGGLVDLMRHRAIERYRSTWRLFEATVDLLGKVVYTIDCLERLPAAAAAAIVVPIAAAPPADRWIPFDQHGAGVWFHRDGETAFQFPVVAQADPASYLPFPHAPGLFENPCDNYHITGAPRMYLDGRQYTTLGRPLTVSKLPHGIALVWDHFIACDDAPYAGAMVPWLPAKKSDRGRLAGRREVVFTVSGRSLRVEERWRFDDLPLAIQLDIAEAAVPLRVVVDCPTPFISNVVAVDGFADWRTVWGTVRQLHQIAITPAHDLQLVWTVSW